MDAVLFRFSHASEAAVAAAAPVLFEHLDDPARLSAHMGKSSAMMAGSTMSLQVDAAGGRAVGSRIGMGGRVLGLTLRVEEAIVERTPPVRKAWRTLGEPRLLVIGAYEMGFEIAAEGEGSRLRVFIRYDLPSRARWRWIGGLPRPVLCTLVHAPHGRGRRRPFPSSAAPPQAAD